MTISVDEIVVEGIPCFRIHFHLPHVYHSTGVESIAVLVPTAYVGTRIYQHIHIFNALLEEIIGWMAGVGPKHSLVRLYHQNNREPLAFSPDWQKVQDGFTVFIRSFRQSCSSFPGLGQISNSHGVIEVTQARTSSGHDSADYILTLTLNNRQRMSLFVSQRVVLLTWDWLLDWLEAQNSFSFPAQ